MKYTVGTRVTLISKLNCELGGSVYNRMKINNQNSAVIIGIDYNVFDNPVYIINTDSYKKTGDFYYESDIIPDIIYQRKEKLLKLKQAL